MRYLSKSQFQRGLQCKRSLWLYRKHPEMKDATSPEQQATFDQGTQIGVLARQWLGGGVLIKADHTDPEKALLETAVAIASGIRVIYEAAFLFDGVLVRADIIAKNPEGGWDLFEVKGSTEVKDLFLNDVAIQRYVIAAGGLKTEGLDLGHAHVVHLDPAYVRRGALDLRQLFKSVDVTADTEPLLAEVPVHLKALKAAAEAGVEPAVEIGPQCTKSVKGYDCDFQGHCWAKVPENSVFDLAGALKKKTTALWRDGVVSVAGIPDGEKLNDYQAIQRATARSGKPHVDAPAIRAFLDTLVYPVHHLDFEAVNPAIPAYDGMRPYQALAFEASLHVQAERGGPVTHHEFIGDGTRDPRRDLTNFLLDRVGPAGSVLAYHKSYESGIIKGLVELVGRSAPDLLSMQERLWDVAEPFKKAWYHHPDQAGSWSIKKVLPITVPDMSYAGLAIKNGGEAMLAYARLMTEKLTPEERAQIMADLRAYCGQDTFAMVRILDFLYGLVGAVAA